jgi:NADH-quinone oxidoreductase subunit L
MVLGVGTGLPIGIVGGLFHMINHAMYKSCLFLTGGSVEHATGTTDLAKLGGLAKKMPLTMICFVIAAASISGCPPFNGFFSKELVYAGALDRGTEFGGAWYLFYVAAILGTFLTAASFLKLGHAVYFGKPNPENDKVKEVSPVMWLPMAVIAGACVLFGVANWLPLKYLIEPFVQSAMGEKFTEAVAHSGGTFAALMPHNMMLAGLAVAALVLAAINHAIGVKRSGSGLHASDHIRYLPVLSYAYEKAEARWFDPYEIFLKFVKVVSGIGYAVDRIIDFLYNGLAVGVTYALSFLIRACHTGSFAMYIAWCLLGGAAVVWFFLKSM